MRALADPRVRVVDLEHRAFAKAINKGIEATAGDFVFFANSDLFVANGYVDEMSAFFERHPRAGARRARSSATTSMPTGRPTSSTRRVT